jgi:hypothetical protein
MSSLYGFKKKIAYVPLLFGKKKSASGFEKKESYTRVSFHDNLDKRACRCIYKNLITMLPVRYEGNLVRSSSHSNPQDYKEKYIKHCVLKD